MFTRSRIFLLISIGIIGLLCLMYRPPKFLRTIRNEIVYRLPFFIPGLPFCPDCNIVLVNLDTLRPDNMGCYGYTRDTTPNLCAYAKKNMMFTQFYTQTSFTLDSHASIFTGLYPTTHHMIEALRDSLNPAIPMLAEVLQRKGYETVWAGGLDDVNLPLDRGFSRGFNTILSVDGSKSSWSDEYKNILPVLESETPAFIFFHSYAPHAPYLPGKDAWHFSKRKFPWIPVSADEFYTSSYDFYAYVLSSYQMRLTSSVSPQSYERNIRMVQAFSQALQHEDYTSADELFWALPMYEQYDMQMGWYWKKIGPTNPEVISYMKDIYDERIYQMDQYIEDMLNYLDRPQIQRKTIVIILSDNGEDFGEHGEFDHGWNIYNSGTHAPFIVSVPRMKAGVYRDLVQAVDVFPTLLDLIGINRTAIPLEGESLLSILRGKGASHVGERYLISQHRGTDVTAIRSTRWKMYKNNTPERGFIELYDLMTDPDEQRDVLGKHMDIARQLDTVLTHTLSASPKYASVSGAFPDWLDEEKRKTLMNEGYF